jgi:outer membrane receptor protein involved in Fe transport
MLKKTPLASAISSITLATALAATSVAVPVFAADDETMIEEVVVTGSRIKRADFTSNAPVATIGSDQIDITGTINTESLLNTMPQMVPGFDRTSNNPGNGTATVDLRGLGSSRTLVLVNGTRANPTTQSGTVDINNIPAALIDRVEVLTGGASAVYGSDAVAGVVNFILKDDFSGVSFSQSAEQTENGDAALYSTNLTFGANFDEGRGNVAVNLSYTDREDLFQGDRDFSTFAQFDSSDANGNPILIDGGSSGVPGTSIFAGGLGNISPDNFGVTFDPDGSVRPFITEGNDNDFYNYAPVNYIQLPQERYQATALAHYELMDGHEAYGRVMYTSSRVPQQLAPTPIFQSGTEFTLDGSPFLTAQAQAALSGNNAGILGVGTRQDRVFADAAGNPATALGAADSGITCTNCVYDSDLTDTDPRLNIGPLQDADGDGIADTGTAFLRRRLREVGPRISDDLYTGFQIKGGIRGEIADTTWSYDAYIQEGSVTSSNTQSGNVNRDRFKQALLLDLTDPTGGTCADTSANGSTTDCAPINIFGEGNISEAGAAFLRTAVAAIGTFDQTVASVNFSGELFEMSGGAVSAAFGYEHQSHAADFRPSQDLAAGTIAGFNGSPASGGAYRVDSYYGELYVPLLRDMAMAEAVDLELAYRSSDYSTVGTVDSFKVSGSWAFNEQIRLRAGFNTAVRAPNIGELFSPQGEGFPGSTDPCAAEGAPSAAVQAICVATGVPASVVGSPAINLAAGQVRQLSGGNPNLTEEDAETLTVGIVVEPEMIEGLTFSVDYFDIEIEDAVAAFGGGANNVLTTCYDAASANGGAGSPFCNAVTRRADGTIDFVSTGSQNVASITLNGIDVLASYDTELFGGNMRLNYVGTFTNESDFTPFEGADTITCAGEFGNDCGEPLPEYKHRVTANWSRDNITAQLLWRYIGESSDDDEGTVYFVETLDGENYFDAAVSYAFNDNFAVNVGVDNLLDTEPPILGDNQEQANTYPATYDVFGRTWYVKGSVTF